MAPIEITDGTLARRAHARDRQLRLSGGRALGWAEYGHPDGDVVVYCHQFPGSRLEAAAAHAPALRRGLRIIGIDRPGYGLSDPQVRRRVIDWPDDVVELLDSLGVEKFRLMGFAGGAPYALACAARYPDRVLDTAILAGLTPLDSASARRALSWSTRFTLRIVGRFLPFVLRPVFENLARTAQEDPQRFAEEILRMAPPDDRKRLNDPLAVEVMLDDSTEAFRQGVDASLQDLRLLGRDWGFRSRDVLSHVWLWHGEFDSHVPIAAARRHAGLLPKCSARFIPDRGHVLGTAVYGEALGALADGRDGAA